MSAAISLLTPLNMFSSSFRGHFWDTGAWEKQSHSIFLTTKFDTKLIIHFSFVPPPPPAPRPPFKSQILLNHCTKSIHSTKTPCQWTFETFFCHWFFLLTAVTISCAYWGVCDWDVGRGSTINQYFCIRLPIERERERERERESVCVWESERESVCVGKVERDNFKYTVLSQRNIYTNFQSNLNNRWQKTQ